MLARQPVSQAPKARIFGSPSARGKTRGRVAGPRPPGSRLQRHWPRFPPLARPWSVASPQARAPGGAHARDAPGRAGHTPPTHSESLSLPALAPSPSGVSQSLPVAAGESLLPPSYPLRGGSSGSSGRGRQRKKETDLIKFPETTTTSKRGPRWGEPPFFPAPLQKPEGPLQVERCWEWGGAGLRRQPLPRRGAPRSCPLRFRLLRWRPRLLRGGSSCQLPAPARRPPAQLHSAEGRREPPPPPPSPRAAEGRGELWRFRVSAGGDSLGARRARTPVPFAWSAEAAPGGARSRLPRQAVPAAARPAFLPSACPPARPRS